ncbi:MAG TPA: glucoamylase family protein, partial [Gemmatimonadaceae bacterium]|nr:glucoamylase family protein [Gemmatimonadaceae bacterium]
VDTVSRRTFDFFWQTTNPRNGLTPDRWPTKSFSSIAAVGFALTAYPIGVERGWVSRDSARARVLTTLRFFWRAPQGPQGDRVSGYKGFYYHFLDMETGYRFQHVELSTIDTSLLLAGILACRQYFDRNSAGEREIRSLADSIYDRVDWQWARDSGTVVSMGWRPEPAPYQDARGFITSTWRGYDEGMILYVLALGSPTHPVDPAAWTEWTKPYQWNRYYGYDFVQFAPLFGHQYSHVWIDFRGLRDAYMRGKGIDYFENSRRATLAQRAFAAADANHWRGYDADVWGLTASDGPTDSTFAVDGRRREFHTYWARGAAQGDVRDDGTIAPTAAGASIVFTPELSIAALRTMRARYGANLFGKYGFVDAFNPTLRTANVPVHQGHIVDGLGWFDTDYLGIDQGPILAMAENWRSGMVWRLMRKDPAIVRGLCRAGFTGGWLHCAGTP